MKHQLTKMGWQVYETSQGEVGIDLLLEARGDGLFDYGLMIAAQVKTGDTWFGSPKKDDAGEVVGWWFEDSKGEHLTYWRDHVLPTVLILHDKDTDTSYWVHVTAEEIQSTGLGLKILVPKDSIIDEDHINALMDVATSGRPASIWEGSAWNNDTAIAGINRLRYALLTPRLVAPHPNRMVKKASPFEAIALLVKMRLRPLQPRPGREAAVPDLETCRSSSMWLWRLYAASYDVLADGKGTEAIQNLIETASKPHERAAASVIVCALHVENQDPQAGLDTIEQALTTPDDYTPADHDWLLLHKARCLSELGELDQARQIAIEVQRLRTLEPNDPTATAISGAGADIIFTVSGWNSDLSGVISGRDTIAAWWRTEEISFGLQHHFDDHFRSWATHTNNNHDEGDAWFRLRAATLIAGMAAEHSAWRHSSALLAKHTLTFASASSEPNNKTAKALTALRRAGDSKSIELAVKRLLHTGPASPVQDAATEVDLDQSTRTSLPADLKLLASAADVLEHDTAKRTCRWILSNLADLDGFAERFKPTFSADHVLLETLARLIPALSDTALRELIEHVLSLPSNGDVGWGHAWARIVRGIPSAAWSEDDRAALAARDNDNSELRHAITTVVAQGITSHRDHLRADIREGNLDALEAFGDVRDLDTDTVEALCAHLEDRIDDLITAMQRDNIPGYAHDPAAVLVLINIWHPAHARWEPVHRLLTFHSPTWVSHLEGMLHRLRRLGRDLPGEVANTLVDPLHMLMLTGIRNQSFFRGEDVRGLAGSALATIKPDAVTDTELWDLMEGSTPEQRQAAIRVIAARGVDGAFDTLWAMSRDRDPWMRAVVANQLAFAASQHEHDARFSTLLERLLADPGTLIARMVAVTLPGRPRSVATDHLADVLRGHISAEVRRHINEYESGAAPVID